MKKQTKIIIISILSIIILIIFFFGLYIIMPATGTSSGDGIPQKSKVSCDVTISGGTNIFGLIDKPKIKSIDCDKSSRCLFSFSMAPLSLLKNEGSMNLKFSDSATTKSYSVSKIDGLLQETISVCTRDSSGTFTLLDSNNQILETRQVVLQ